MHASMIKIIAGSCHIDTRSSLNQCVLNLWTFCANLYATTDFVSHFCWHQGSRMGHFIIPWIYANNVHWIELCTIRSHISFCIIPYMGNIRHWRFNKIMIQRKVIMFAAFSENLWSLYEFFRSFFFLSSFFFYLPHSFQTDINAKVFDGFPQSPVNVKG